MKAYLSTIVTLLTLLGIQLYYVTGEQRAMDDRMYRLHDY